jgi:hypothetical protein
MSVDGAIAELAGRQHGRVARRQLTALGLSASAIDRRLRAERLLPVYQGVYAVGHRTRSLQSAWMAAVLSGRGGGGAGAAPPAGGGPRRRRSGVGGRGPPAPPRPPPGGVLWLAA